MMLCFGSILVLFKIKTLSPQLIFHVSYLIRLKYKKKCLIVCTELLQEISDGHSSAGSSQVSPSRKQRAESQPVLLPVSSSH